MRTNPDKSYIFLNIEVSFIFDSKIKHNYLIIFRIFQQLKKILETLLGLKFKFTNDLKKGVNASWFI